MENVVQDITIYHKSENGWIKHHKKASVRNTFIKNRDNTGSSNVNSALIRIFDVEGYKKTYNLENGDVIVSKKVNDLIISAPLTELRKIYGKDSVYSVDTVESFIFQDKELLELNHIKIGAK